MFQLAPFGSSLRGSTERDPNKPDIRSSVVSDTDLLNGYREKTLLNNLTK